MFYDWKCSHTAIDYTLGVYIMLNHAPNYLAKCSTTTLLRLISTDWLTIIKLIFSVYYNDDSWYNYH